jgi:HEAT repeat protein/CRP-like cAMP-binding protein
MRLYPVANPQVQRSNDFFLKAFKTLLESGVDRSITIAFSDQKILVCGEQLPDKDQTRPQIQGLIVLFNRLKIHSFTFQPTFDKVDCDKFIQILSHFLTEKIFTEPITTLLGKAGINSIIVDAKRYVAIHEGEQVIREELLSSGLRVSDKELSNSVLGKPGRKDALLSISSELVKELIGRLPETTGRNMPTEGLTEAIMETLQNLSEETDLNKRSNNIEASASTLSGLDPGLLAQLTAHLPATPVADEMLRATLHRMTQPQLNALITHFITQQTAREGPRFDTDPLTLASRQVDQTGLNRMLGHYEQLLNIEQQAQVAQQAGAQIASLEGAALGNIFAHTFKGDFGGQLYQQVINQISDEKFEKLARQFQAITEGQDELPLDLQSKDIEEAYKKLLQTVRGEKMRAIIEMSTHKEKDRQGLTTIDLDNLLQGNLKGLEQKDISAALPGTIRNLLSHGNEKTADALLMQLAATPQHQKPLIQTNAALTLASVAEHLDNMGEWQRLDKLLPALRQGLRSQGADEQSIRQTITAIGGLTSHYFAEKEYNQAFGTTRFLRTLSSEDLLTTGNRPLIREHAIATLKNLCTKPVLDHLMDLFLHSENQQETAGQLLIELGEQSTKFQIQQLISNTSRFERKRLLALIKQTGQPATSILLEELRSDAPWFVIRNIIHLLGKIGNSSIVEKIQPYIGHTDLRVQQETLNTTVIIGGDTLNDFLLDALQTVDDSLKIKVVNHIATTKDDRFVSPLTDLLESTKPFIGKNKNNLHLAICKALGMIGSKRAITSLNRVMQSRNPFDLGGYSHEVRQAASLALDQIRNVPALLKKRLPGEGIDTQEYEHQLPVATSGTLSVSIDEEAEIFTIAAQGGRDQALKRLLDLITSTARAGDFQTAERLRERIYEIDSLALSEIIRSGEIIEQEKGGAIKEDDLEVWAALTDRLSSEEFSTMYHELTEHHYKPEETVVSQGDKNDSLFFIAQGSVKVSHKVGPRDIFITSLNRGQIAGDNFFAPAFWTVSLISLTTAKVYILEQTALHAIQEKFPGLRAKLQKFYTASNTIQSTLKKKGLDRRKEQRFNLSRKIQVQPITNIDSPIGRGFRAEIIDIAPGGVAFIIRISRQETARLLLGRRLQIVLPIGNENKFLTLKGMVVSIQPFHILENDFSIHFSFEQPLEQQVLQTILG